MRRKPLPLNTIDLQKLASKRLHFASSLTMEVAERLYNKGYISYPRTETNRFSQTIDLEEITQDLKRRFKEFTEFE